MAATMGPEIAVDATPVLPDLDDHSSAHHLPVPVTGESGNAAAAMSSFTTPQPSPRNAPPLPNPPFVFPARPSSSSAPSSFSKATGRRPKSAMTARERPLGLDDEDLESSLRSSPALPAFSFNPGAALPAEKPGMLSPPLSPQSPRPIPSPLRPGGQGHRRGGSEFVGGHLRSGEAITVISTSPTKEDSGFASPTFKPPPAGRRGHAHRRSAAISSHDLSLILQPNPNVGARGSSAPASPADFGNREPPAFTPQDKTPTPVESEPIPPRPESPDESGKATPVPQSPKNKPPSPAKAVPRARVGFSDTLEFIPRPLSLVSTDTSSTITARPGHSVSGSISSIVSMTPSSAVDRDAPTLIGPSPPRKRADSRPSTAGPVLERTQSSQTIEPVDTSPRRRNSIPTLITIPDASSVSPPEPSPSKTPKRWSFFGLEPFAAANSQNRPRPQSASSNESTAKSVGAAPSPSETVPESAIEAVEGEPAPQKRSSKKGKKKKGKTWAGSILTRKSKPRKKSKQACRSPTPPVLAEPEVESDTSKGDASDSAIPCPPTLTITESTPQGSGSWKTRSITPDDETSYPVIDLDAALGPFNTPLPLNPEWEAAQKAAGHSKRQLHSAQGLKGFSGPGMHYHRRAESAPEMVPFEGHRFGIHRFGSSSTMADVFEEDEEEESTSADTNSDIDKNEEQDGEQSSNGSATPPASAVLASGPIPSLKEPSAGPSTVRRVASGLSTSEKAPSAMSIKSERSTSSLRNAMTADEPVAVEFRTNSIFHETPDSSASATPSPRRILAGRDLAPVEISPLHLPVQSQTPISPYSMSHSSSFPSPRSPMSYDAQRISTAPSSVNDENNFQSLLMGEPGPEVRISVDDIPSLTSSNSTMTRESSFAQNPQLQHVPFRGSDQPRPASVSSAAFGRRRSSLASLSRLISSSHGERSKLSMEVTLDNEPDKKPKPSKAKRLSRLMQFWKPSKEASP